MIQTDPVDLDWIPEVADQSDSLIRWLIVEQWGKALIVLGFVLMFLLIKTWGSRRS